MRGVEAAWEKAKGRWPGVALALDDFARAIGDADVASLATDDVYLACACARGDRAACDAFEREHVARLGAFLARVERDAAALDEVKQRVRARLLVGDADRAPRIAEYAGRGSLAAWVRVVALRTHATWLAERSGTRAIASGEELDALDALVAAGAVDVAVARAEHRAVVESALAEALRALPPRDRTVMRMHYVDGLSLERIGRVYGVDKATVSRWMRAGERVADAALARVQDATGASADEARSLMGLLLSAMSLSLPGLLESIDAGATAS